jgi:hypothetical protein
MEVVENNKSKMTERVTISSLLQFIKDNTQQFQPKEEMVIEKVKVKVKDKLVKENTNTLANREKNKTFEEKLIESTKPMKFLKYDSIYISRYLDSSFLNSILFFLNDNTITSEIIISGLKRFIQYGGFTDFGYSKLKWNKKTIINSIDNNIIDEYYIRTLSDYLHINILILNHKAEYLTFFGDFYLHRKTVVLYNYNEKFYPIFDKETIFFTSNAEFITKLKPETIQSKLDTLDIYGQLKISEFLPEIKIDDSLIPHADPHSVINGFDDYDSDKDDNDENDNDENDNDENDNDENDDKDDNDDKDNKDNYSKLSYKELQLLAKKLQIDVKINGKLLTKEKLCIKIKEKQS